MRARQRETFTDMVMNVYIAQCSVHEFVTPLFTAEAATWPRPQLLQPGMQPALRRSGDLVDALARGAAVLEALHAVGGLGVAKPLVPLLVQRRAVHPQVGVGASVGAQWTAAPWTQGTARPRTLAARRPLSVGPAQSRGVVSAEGRQKS